MSVFSLVQYIFPDAAVEETRQEAASVPIDSHRLVVWLRLAHCKTIGLTLAAGPALLTDRHIYESQFEPNSHRSRVGDIFLILSLLRRSGDW